MPEKEERKKVELDKIIEAFKDKKAISDDELLNRMDRLQLNAQELDEVYDVYTEAFFHNDHRC